jgi:hypothetical protein
VSILNEGIPELLAELKSNKVSTLTPPLSGLLSNAFEKNPFGKNMIIIYILINFNLLGFEL